MNVKKSVISLCVISVMMGAAWETAVAKQTGKDDDSVKRWGRWAVLSPAAGQEETGGFTTTEATNDLGSCQSSENCPTIATSGEPVVPPEPPPPPPPPPEVKSPCEAGMPCGFARIDTPYDASQESKPDESHVVPFELTLDKEGSTVAFVVDPGSKNEIASDTVPAIFIGNDVITWPGTPDDLSGSITPDESGEPGVVQGPWRHSDYGDGESTTVNGGEYVWGAAATSEQMQNLISSLGGDMTAVYQGSTMGTVNGGEGAVLLEINFSTDTWRGEFNNNAFTVDEGVVVDSGFVTVASSKFSSNVASGDVKGAFVNAGNNAIGGYEVEFKNGLKDADVFNTVLQRAN